MSLSRLLVSSLKSGEKNRQKLRGVYIYISNNFTTVSLLPMPARIPENCYDVDVEVNAHKEQHAVSSLQKEPRLKPDPRRWSLRDGADTCNKRPKTTPAACLLHAL
jgi:hypothetical protein